jgi:hypothetical protein
MVRSPIFIDAVNNLYLYYSVVLEFLVGFVSSLISMGFMCSMSGCRTQ